MKREAGFILVTVLGLMALLSLLLVGLSQTLHQSAAVARIERSGLEERAAAESGVELAAAGLLAPDRFERWIADGRPYRFAINGKRLEIRVFDAREFIDINRADPAVLAGFLRNMGIGEITIANAVEGVRSRRQPASQHPGAAIGFADGMRRGEELIRPFLSVGELWAEIAGSAAGLEKATALATVLSQDGLINPLIAPRDVLAAIPDISSLEVEAILAARAKGRADGEDFLSLVKKYGRFLTLDAGNVYRVSVNIDGQTTLQATIVTGGDSEAPFHVLDWN